MFLPLMYLPILSHQYTNYILCLWNIKKHHNKKVRAIRVGIHADLLPQKLTRQWTKTTIWRCISVSYWKRVDVPLSRQFSGVHLPWSTNHYQGRFMAFLQPNWRCKWSAPKYSSDQDLHILRMSSCNLTQQKGDIVEHLVKTWFNNLYTHTHYLGWIHTIKF